MQRRIADEVREGAAPALILLEHPHTYTLGVRGKQQHVLASEGLLRSRGAKVVRTDRGGDVTYHGPGQLVGYPILDLRALGLGPAAYVSLIEDALIAALRAFGISGCRSDLNRGVWVDGAKAAAIGVRISRGITTHGFALNVNTDLSYFEHIVPCGLPGVRVTSMAECRGVPLDLAAVEVAVAQAFAETLGVEVDAPAATRAPAELIGAAGGS
ncbi:MAG TPA: lipoyl(octanoyl) transferase LipB [Dehalococcoidia bacterium]|nr:lipoyl(octanoyl) transferase LipB [Dehalococcoidia bacterium]